MDIKEIKNLTKEYKYKIDLHTHTSPASPCSEIKPERMVEAYKEKGFDGIVLTNHFIDFLIKSDDPKTVSQTYLDDYYKTKEIGDKKGVKVYLGMEIRFPENCNDYLIYGIDENDVKELFSYIHGDYISFYKAFKNEKNVILQAHPFRNNMVLQNPDYIDGIETFNVHPNHNSRVGIASQYANKFPHFIKTCGTDFHHEGHQALGATLTKTLPEDSFGIAEILKSGDYLFNVAGSIIIP